MPWLNNNIYKVPNSQMGFYVDFNNAGPYGSLLLRQIQANPRYADRILQMYVPAGSVGLNGGIFRPGAPPYQPPAQRAVSSPVNYGQWFRL